MSKPVAHSCKIGTVPALVYFARAYKPRVGLRMLVRDAMHGSKPFRVVVTKVGATGDEKYFFADRD